MLRASGKSNKKECRTWFEFQVDIKDMNFKPLIIEKPNHNDWVLLVESDIPSFVANSIFITSNHDRQNCNNLHRVPG